MSISIYHIYVFTLVNVHFYLSHLCIYFSQYPFLFIISVQSHLCIGYGTLIHYAYFD